MYKVSNFVGSVYYVKNELTINPVGSDCPVMTCAVLLVESPVIGGAGARQ